MVDKDGEIIVIDELMKVLPTWLKRGGFLSDSHSNRILGRGTGFRRLMVKDEDDQEHDAIEMKGYIFDDYELDHDVWDKMKSGEYRGLSFGGATKSDREPTYLPDGRIAYKLKDLEAYEIAICREPANPLALITSINTIAKSSKNINYTKKSDDEICIKCDNVGCYVVKSLIDITKPFAGYKDFDACVASNKDKGDPQAYCATIMRSVEGKNKDHPVKNQYNGSLFCLQCGEDPYSKDSKLNQDVEKGAVEDMTHDKCPHCGYIPMDGQDTVQDHMNKEHPSQTINSYNTFDSLGREPELLDGSPESYRERAGLPQPQPTQQNGNENYNRSESEPSKLPPQMEEIEKKPEDVGITEKKKLFEYGGFSYDHYGSGRDTIRNEDQDLKPGDNTGNEDTTVTKGKIFSKKEVGYIETPVMKSCGTCEYFKSPDVCRLPLDSPVDPVDGCCNFWDQKVTIEKGEDGKAKIKLEGEPAERLLEQAGVIPEKVVKAPKPGGWPVKPNANPQPQTSHITVHGSSDTVNDPNPQESPFQIG
ncbi:MAG: hypothetical protein KGN01_08255, partial [Patescibacteria group bacterium]|nr:hypothetical protein [Patescibacteria group bacterium]